MRAHTQTERQRQRETERLRERERERDRETETGRQTKIATNVKKKKVRCFKNWLRMRVYRDQRKSGINKIVI